MVLNAPKSREEIQGFEFDWLASDVGGFVALFSTAGAGDVPNAFLQDTGAHEKAIGFYPGTFRAHDWPESREHLETRR
jgi:hypothetical protein